MLNKKYRLHYKKDFQEVFQNGKYKHLSNFLTIHYLEKTNIKNNKYAFIISKKTEKKAVIRHKILRQIRHIFIDLIKNNKINNNYYIIIVIRKNFINLKYQEKYNKTLELLKLIHLIK